jgi:hypothetical protein
LGGDGYLDMINQQIAPVLGIKFGQRQNGAIPDVWWTQDGAPAHRRADVRARLQTLFGNRVIAFGHAREWPPRSPDLTPLDFFLWGYLKGKVYRTEPASLADLRRRITNEITAMGRTRMVRRSFGDMQKRARRCINLHGAHVEGRDAR